MNSEHSYHLLDFQQFMICLFFHLLSSSAVFSSLFVHIILCRTLFKEKKIVKYCAIILSLKSHFLLRVVHTNRAHSNIVRVDVNLIRIICVEWIFDWEYCNLFILTAHVKCFCHALQPPFIHLRLIFSFAPTSISILIKGYKWSSASSFAHTHTYESPYRDETDIDFAFGLPLRPIMIDLSRYWLKCAQL